MCPWRNNCPSPNRGALRPASRRPLPPPSPRVWDRKTGGRPEGCAPTPTLSVLPSFVASVSLSMPAPIFIVGANRSGTTLLRLLLNAHSAVAIPDEINYFYGFDWTVSYSQWRSPSLSPAAYEAFVDRFLTTNAPNVPGLDCSALREEILGAPADLRCPYQLLLQRWAALHGKPRWGEKTPGNIYHADLLIDMFPDALFVHVVRDPRGGVASMNRVSFFPDDAVLNALNRHKVMTHGRAFLRRAVPARQRTEVRYEDLVAAPRETLDRLCGFLDLPYEEQMLRFHLDAERFMTEAASSSFNAAATTPISRDHAERWRTDLSADQIASVELLCADEMAEFGYERLRPSLSWKGALNLAVKWCYWHVQWWRHRKDVHFSVVTPMFQRSRDRLRGFTQWMRRGIRRTLFSRSV